MEQFSTLIVCPYCNREIALDEALTHQIREKIRVEFSEELRKREEAFRKEKALLAAREKEVEDLKGALTKQLAEEKEKMAREYDQRLKITLAKAEVEAQRKARELLSGELKDLKEQNDEKERKLKEFQEKELELRREKRKVEEEKENLNLRIARTLDEEREKIRQETAKRVSEEYTLKEREKEKIIADLRKQMEEMQRKAEQSSQQLQGEVLEMELEELLRAAFKHDTVEPVPKGMRGADLIQRVCTRNGQACGTIIWETKRTKAWSDGWIDKLKEDQREAKADIAVIVSTTLPRDAPPISQAGGVWIVDHLLAVPLATVLRSGLVQVAMAREATAGKSEKMEMLYEYLAGPQFRHQIEGIVEAFVSMRKDLDGERRAMEKIWAKREKQIEQVVRNTARMYGSLQGIVGGTALPGLKTLELAATQETTDDLPV